MSQPTDHQEDSLLQLEEELRALVPAETSAGLRDRIFSALTEPVSSARAEVSVAPAGQAWFGWISLAAAAAVAILAVVLSPVPRTNSLATSPNNSFDSRPEVATPVGVADEAVSSSSWKPVSSDSRLEHVGYEGIRTEDRATYRQIRTRSMERRTFVDPSSGTVVEVVFPRENIHLLPVVPE